MLWIHGESAVTPGITRGTGVGHPPSLWILWITR